MATQHQAWITPRADEPLRRLSRFDGTTFHPVEPGSVKAGFVHVFVHGWQPGFWLQERFHAVGDLVSALPAWDPRLIDPTGRTLSSYYLQLLEALAGLGPEHCVLHYSWLDESATDAELFLAYRSRQATQINGRRLALALQQALHQTGSEPDARIQLIGHSHGSAVAVHAAAALEKGPEQVTLLDAPENRLSRLSGAANLMDVVLPRLTPGRTEGRTFVDSYSSVFGSPYHRMPGLSGVVDVMLTPGNAPSHHVVRAVNAAHLYAVDWYARSVREATRGVGYGWSPLAGAAVARLHPAYRSLWPLRPLELTRMPEVAWKPWERRIEARAVRRGRITGAELQLDPARPTAAMILSSLPGDGLIEFDVEVEGGDGSEQVQLDLDAITVYVAQARYPVPPSGRYVMLADGRPGDHLLTARLVVGDPDSQVKVRVTNVTIVSWPAAAPGFTFRRLAWTTFTSGALSGSVATVLVGAGLAGLRRRLRGRSQG
ncbi:hypothetical protein LWF15_21280 [Kineosporia rhizophila]|uniref:hypothetical protein n=1 Tax=Kineosporia TaxID=49184 RepID=UPI001E3705A9|nr:MULTISPECIES: hypothetical protein [Kineosporia]MCE0538030.1 hypothetical protein [Kineosporia rhizophila]GLY17081.1 hypothetical protein Kisp01_40960 [Kineosporia sp. NBRC 101677]